MTTSSPTRPDVTIVNRAAFPLSRQVDAEAGKMVLNRVEALGVQVLTHVSVDNICTSRSIDGELFTGLNLSDGTHLDAQLVVFAIGITPRDEIARKAGIQCSSKRGIIVDDNLCSSALDVYAIGECASWNVNNFLPHKAVLTMMCVGDYLRPHFTWKFVIHRNHLALKPSLIPRPS
jgi:nitrite reductase (NAD(P)H)